MKKLISISLILLLILLQTPLVFALENNSEEINITAKSAVLMDAKSGKIIYEKNSHEKLPPASVTKIMTMLLIMEAIEKGSLKFKDKVSISEHAASMGGSQLVYGTR